MQRKGASSGLVYSTELGRTCPNCRQALAQCQCAAERKRPASDGVVRIARETKGRGGKAVTVVKGVPLDDADLAVLGKRLKALCGSGGTVKDGVLEVQGDHVERLMEFLKTQGYVVRRSGG